MKIAFLTSTLYSFSGIDRVIEQQVKEFSRQGHEVEIFTLAAQMYPKGAKVHILGMPNSLFWQRIYRLLFFIDLLKIWKTSSMLKSFDVIYSHQYPMNWIAMMAKFRYDIKYIYYDYGIANPEAFPSILEKLYLRLFIFLNNLSVKNADEAISISKFLQKELHKQTELKSKVVYPKLDKARFPKKLTKGKIRRRHKLGNRPIALFVGRLSPHKGLYLLIELFNRVLKSIPNAVLLIVGKPTYPDYMRQLERLKGDSKNIIFCGEVKDEDLPYYYVDCDVYVTASLWEGYNLPVAEAQYYGKPVVAFKIGAHSEVVERKELLVNLGDNEDFADKLIQLFLSWK